MVEPNSRHHMWGGNRTTIKREKNPLKKPRLSYMFTLNAVAVCGFRERSIIGCTIGAVVATREMDKVYMQVFERERGKFALIA